MSRITRDSPVPLQLPGNFRCPDCQTSFRQEAAEKTDVVTGTRCSGCERVFKYNDGVLGALPSSMSIAGGANLEYYNSMSERENNLLIRRALTRTHRIKFQMVKEALQLDRCDLEVLEIGIGVGAHGASVLELGNSYTGLDISEGLLCNALKNYPVLENARLVCADATQLPYDDASFDAGYFVATLHHLPDPEKGVVEFVRVLRPGARFCFLEPRRFYPTQTLQYLKHPDSEVSAMKMTPRNVRKWLKASGVNDVRIDYAVYTPNKPRALLGLYDRIDNLCDRAGLHFLAVMMCVSGTKSS